MNQIPEEIVSFFEQKYEYPGCLSGVKVFCNQDKREEIAQSFESKFAELIDQEIWTIFNNYPWAMEK